MSGTSVPGAASCEVRQARCARTAKPNLPPAGRAPHRTRRFYASELARAHDSTGSARKAPGSRAPVGPLSAAALTEPIARPARLCTQMPAKARTAPELLEEEAKVFEQLVALCATHGL